MKDYIYYLPINSNLLPTYIGKGLIPPRVDITSAIPDIQSYSENNLVLTRHKWVSYDGLTNDCSLEVILTEAEAAALKSIGEIFLFGDALPISRIRKFLFSNLEQKSKTAYNIEQADGFLPPLVEIDSNPVVKTLTKVDLKVPGKKKDRIASVQKFDQLLGAFALMRLSGRISKANKSNFSENYFPTLSAINETIKTECEHCGISTKSNFTGVFLSNGEPKWNEKFLNILTSNPRNESEYMQSLISFANTTERHELIDAISGSLGVKWEKLKENDSYSIALAVLYRYGQGKRKSLRDLFNDFSLGKIPFSKKLESLLFLFGYHYGYSSLTNKETINGSKEPLKYEMNSQLDYFTIESVYQWAFRQTPEKDYEYLTWAPKFSNSTESECYILDVPVQGVSREAVEELNVFQNLKERFVSFFLEREYAHFSSTLIELMKKEVLAKVETLLTDFKQLEHDFVGLTGELKHQRHENNLLKNELLKIEKENSELKERHAFLEKQLISLQNVTEVALLKEEVISEQKKDDNKGNESTYTRSKDTKQEVEKLNVKPDSSSDVKGVPSVPEIDIHEQSKPDSSCNFEGVLNVPEVDTHGRSTTSGNQLIPTQDAISGDLFSIPKDYVQAGQNNDNKDSLAEESNESEKGAANDIEADSDNTLVEKEGSKRAKASKKNKVKGSRGGTISGDSSID